MQRKMLATAFAAWIVLSFSQPAQADIHIAVPVAGTAEATHQISARFETIFTHYDGKTFSGDIWTQEAGLDYIWNDRVLIGLVGRYDAGTFDDFASGGTVDGEGFTGGLRAGALLFPGITIDGYLTHTWLDYRSDVPLGRGLFMTAATNASRVDGSVNLAGQFALSQHLALEPNVRFSYTREVQSAYVTSLGQAVAQSTTSSGALGFGSALRFTHESENGQSSSLYASLHGDYDFAIEQGQTSLPLPSLDHVWTMRLGAGLNTTFANGVSLSLDGEVDRLGTDFYMRYTAKGRITVPF